MDLSTHPYTHASLDAPICTLYHRPATPMHDHFTATVIGGMGAERLDRGVRLREVGDSSCQVLGGPSASLLN